MNESESVFAPNPIIEDRVESLLAQMTVAEKAAQLTSVWLTLDQASGEVAPSQFVGSQGATTDPWEQMRHGIGQVTRPLGSQPIDPADGARMVNTIQRRLIETSRLGIPAIMHEECLTGPMFQGATSFSSPLNMSSTWDPGLVRRVGDVIRRQLRIVGAHQGLAPVADVARDARWGRVEETFGEDPFLVGTMVSAYVDGLQGSDPTTGIIATLKHFAGYSFSEGGRNFAPAHVGRRELADVFLLPFEMAVRDAGAGSVMNAYQEIDGEPPAASHWLLTEVLREQWGFEGFVVADYGAVGFLRDLHGVAADSAECATKSLRAGLDVELPTPAEFLGGIPEALDRGLLDGDTLDLAVARVLRAKFALGLFDEPYVDVDAVEAGLDTAADRALAAELARSSMTLLTNDGTLPLDPAAVCRVAVVGPNADEVMALFGNYSFENHIVSSHFPDAAGMVDVPTVLASIRLALPNAEIDHVPGVDVMSTETAGIAAAVAAAQAADLVIAVVGDKAGHFGTGTVGEGTDAVDLSLPGAQPHLIEEVLDTGTPVVVVLLSGRPHALGLVAERAAAVVAAWFPGQDGGAAVADVLVGKVNPGGRTPVTFSRSAGAMPAYYNHKRLARGLPRVEGFRPVFPFGHGLSYTSFEYTDLALPVTVDVAGEIAVGCTVTNVGARAGDEVVQLYLADPEASVVQPVRSLKGFIRLSLGAGESQRVTFRVPTDMMSFTGLEHQRVLEPGEINVAIGASSADLRLVGSVTLVGAVRVLDGDWRRAPIVALGTA